MDVIWLFYLKINKESVKIILDFIEKDGEYWIALPSNKTFDDEDDKIFYELYKSGDVDYLITGNKKHFPKEKGIVTAREFMDIIVNFDITHSKT